MNKRDWIVLAVIANFGYRNHRNIVERTGYSLGLVNSSLKKLLEEGYLGEDFRVTEKAAEYTEKAKPKRAVILAAGMGLRMVPINRVPKGLLKINGEPLIERIIKQLHEVDIKEITVVVGFMAESLEYLTDKYSVELIYDHGFSRRDSLHSLTLVSDRLSNCYVVPSNVWFARNPFNAREYFSWYAVSEIIDDDSYLRINRKMELVYTEDESGGNSMVGLGYLLEEDGKTVGERLLELDRPRKNHRLTWERALFSGTRLIPYARIMLGQSAYSIETYEQLRELDSESQDLYSRRINLISHVFKADESEITDISAMLKSMTNTLMRFSVRGEPYILRVPGEGSNELTNRRQEAEVYLALDGRGITDEVVYISPNDGYKIAKYINNSRRCDSKNPVDVAACIRHLRRMHDMKLTVSHPFDIEERLLRYEELRGDKSSFSDYEETRGKFFELIDILKELPGESCLCHIDSVSDNFLFVEDEVFLIDWEYAGMCDPHIDIAMFCLYACFTKEEIDSATETYFNGKPDDISYLKVYAYTAAAGFLWTVWCEYKEKMGVNFGDYAMKQYRFAKQYYLHAKKLADKIPIITLRPPGQGGKRKLTVDS